MPTLLQLIDVRTDCWRGMAHAFNGARDYGVAHGSGALNAKLAPMLRPSFWDTATVTT